MKNTKKNDVLKISMPYLKLYTKDNSLNIDPATIGSTMSYFIVNSLYLPLFYLGPNGEIKPGVISNYDVNKNILTLEVNSKVKTASGYVITAKDVYYTLKRLLILDSNSHGKLKLFLSNSKKIETLKDDCPDLILENDKVKLILAKKNFVPFILKVMASSDFSVIPFESYEHNTKKLKIVNFKSTSGVYWLETISDDGKQAILKVNKNHFLYNHTIAKEIHLIDTGNLNSFESIKNNNVDVLSYNDEKLTPHQLKQLKSLDFHIYPTQPIMATQLTFKQNAIHKFDLDKRIKISLDIRAAIQSALGPSVEGNISKQFFPNLSFGHLNNEQLAPIEDMIKKVENKEIKIENKLKIVLLERDLRVFKQHLEQIPYLQLVSLDMNASIKKIREIHNSADITLFPGDTGFTEDISLISYYLNTSLSNLSITPDEGNKWLKDYMAIEDKNKRRLKFKEFHLKILKNFTFVPIFLSSFYTITSPNWIFEGGDLYASGNLWTFKKK